MRGVVTLGAGISGLGFSYHYNHLTDIYEQEKSWGGNCRSHFVNGYTFDEGIHISFTRDACVREIFARSVAEQYRELAPVVYNVYESHWVRHPVEINLKGLPTDLIRKCLLDFIRSEQDRDKPAENYHEWLVSNFGQSLTQHFHGAYTRKYWTVEAQYLTTDWIEQRIYRPSLEEVLRGAITNQVIQAYYINLFRYPRQGGYQSFLTALVEGAAIKYSHKLIELDLKNKKLSFENGFQCYYDTVISSIPLPEIIRCIKDCPLEVKEAALKLTHTSVVLVNLGVKREDIAKCHWFYLYDEGLLPARVHFPNSLSGCNAPPGYTGIQAEIYYSTLKPLDASRANLLERTIANLGQIGILAQDDNIDFSGIREIPYANIIFDHNYRKNRGVILDFLGKNRIYCIGRYGKWDYLWSDQSLLSGKRAAERLGGDLK